jgi:hypothetical protein
MEEIQTGYHPNTRTQHYTANGRFGELQVISQKWAGHSEVTRECVVCLTLRYAKADDNAAHMPLIAGSYVSGMQCERTRWASLYT